MRIPTTRILKYAAMGVIAACIATLFLKKEKPKGHPRDYAEIADQQVIRAATEYNSISFHVDGDTLAVFIMTDRSICPQPRLESNDNP